MSPSRTGKRGHLRGDAFPHPEKSTEWLKSCLEYPEPLPQGGVLGMSHREETQGKTQDSFEGLFLSAGK